MTDNSQLETISCARNHLLRCLHEGESPDDTLFNRIFEGIDGDTAQIFFSPLEVALRTARFFGTTTRRILDVGSGAGKFCLVAGMMHPETEVVGIEYRPGLVSLGRFLARKFALSNVRFVSGDAMQVAWDDYDGLYLFNPFHEHLFAESRLTCPDHSSISLSKSRYEPYVTEARTRLRALPHNTRLVLYGGFDVASESTTGPLPEFDLLESRKINGIHLEFLQKTRSPLVTP